MKIFIIDPQMTMTDYFTADEFNKEVIKELRSYGVELYEVNIKNIGRMKVSLSNDAIVIVYNEHDVSEQETGDVKKLLLKALEKGARIWPVAIDRRARTPMEVI